MANFDDLYKEIADGNINVAIESLKSFLNEVDDETLQQELILLSSRNSKYETRQRKGLISENHQEFNKIVTDLLAFTALVARKYNFDLGNLEEHFEEVEQIIREGRARKEAGKWLEFQSENLIQVAVDEVKALSDYYRHCFIEANNYPSEFFAQLITFIYTTLRNDGTVSHKIVMDYLGSRGFKIIQEYNTIYAELFSKIIGHIEGDNNLPISKLAKDQLLLFLKAFLNSFRSN